MRIAVIGGGPGGLYFAALAKQLERSTGRTGESHEITVWERNAPDDTFGFGVVFSDETLGGIEHADPVDLRARCRREFARWDDIDVHFRGEVVTSGGHGFAAMSRRTAAGDPAGALPRARRDAALPHRGARRRRAGRATHDLVDRLRRGQLGGPGEVRRHLPARPSSPRLQVHVARHRQGLRRVQVLHRARPRTASCRCTATRTTPRAARSSSRCTTTVWRAAGFADVGRPACAPGESDEESIARVRELFADVLDGPRRDGQQLQVDQLHHGPQRALARTATWCCSATPRTPRTSPSAPAPSSPWRTRWRWPPACTSSRHVRRGAGGVRGRAPAGGAVHPARGAGQPGVVREPRPVRRPGARCSSRSTS